MNRFLMAAFVALSLAGDVPGASQRKIFNVIIDGKPFKPTKRLTALTVGPTLSYMQSLSLSASRWPNQGRALQSFLGISCDVLGKSLPLTTTCYGSYSEEMYGDPTSYRDWGGLSIEFTVDSFDGHWAIGRFGGVLPDGDGPPIVVEGFFSLPLEQASPF